MRHLGKLLVFTTFAVLATASPALAAGPAQAVYGGPPASLPWKLTVTDLTRQRASVVSLRLALAPALPGLERNFPIVDPPLPRIPESVRRPPLLRLGAGDQAQEGLGCGTSPGDGGASPARSARFTTTTVRSSSGARTRT